MMGVMKIYGFLFTVGYVIALKDINIKLSSTDLDVVTRLIKLVQPKCVVFVEDYEDVSLVKGFKGLTGSDFYHTIVNSSFLEYILAKNVTQFSFFQSRTAIVMKERLNLTSLLSEVFFPHFLTWIILEDHTQIRDLYIPVSSQVIFIDSSSGITSAKQVYHLEEGKYEIVKTLNLNDSIGFRPPKEKRMNFQQTPMRMLVYYDRENCTYLHDKRLMRKLECVHQDYLAIIGEMLNFSIIVVECREKVHAFTYPNGSDSELFLRHKHREVDFSAISHVIRHRTKRDYMAYVWPTFVLRTRMYLKQGRLTGHWTSYLRPLESSVWWGILLWIIGTGILVQIFEKLLLNRFKMNFSFILDLIISILNSLQVFCNQAVADIPPSFSIRIVFFLKFFVVLIFFQAYCGYLVSSLTVIVSRFPFNDLKGLFENEDYQVMTLRNGFHEFYFRKVIGEGQRENFILPRDELPLTIQAGVDILCERENLALAEFKEDLLTFDKLKCKIAELPTPVAYLFVGIGMPIKAPLKEYLQREWLTLRASGVAQKLTFRLSTHSNFRDDNTQDEFSTVSMSQIFTVFILLGLGVLLSTAILIIELILNKRRKSAFHYPDCRIRKYGSHRFSRLRDTYSTSINKN